MKLEGKLGHVNNRTIKLYQKAYIYTGDIGANGDPYGWGEAVRADITTNGNTRWSTITGTFLNGNAEGIVKIKYIDKECEIQEMYRGRRFGRSTSYREG